MLSGKELRELSEVANELSSILRGIERGETLTEANLVKIAAGIKLLENLGFSGDESGFEVKSGDIGVLFDALEPRERMAITARGLESLSPEDLQGLGYTRFEKKGDE